MAFLTAMLAMQAGARYRARLLCGVLLLLMLAPAHAGPSEYDLKAAFIYQIAKFVEWPSSSAPLRLCILGGNPFGASLESIRGKQINERKLEITLLDIGANIRECNVLFVATNADKYLERIVAVTRGAGTLTIADTDGFARRGAMVNFFLENAQVRFEINLDAARQGGVKISSKLLSLARIVDFQQDR